MFDSLALSNLVCRYNEAKVAGSKTLPACATETLSAKASALMNANMKQILLNNGYTTDIIKNIRKVDLMDAVVKLWQESPPAANAGNNRKKSGREERSE